MKISELKIIVKSLVRECINDILAEKFIEQKVHESLASKESKMPKTTITEIATYNKPNGIAPKQHKLRADIVKSLGIDEGSPLESIFEDTYYNNPAIKESQSIDPQGTISEPDMEKIGIMKKDWTKFL